MNHLLRKYILRCAFIGLSLACGLAHAHLMPAQKGTLNKVGDKLFMVLALPISTFKGLDRDGNGEVSLSEFNSHRAHIMDKINAEIALSAGIKSIALEDAILSPVSSHHTPSAIDQITLMGKYTLDETDKKTLRFRYNLYNAHPSKQWLTLSVTEQATQTRTKHTLTPSHPVVNLF